MFLSAQTSIPFCTRTVFHSAFHPHSFLFRFLVHWLSAMIYIPLSIRTIFYSVFDSAFYPHMFLFYFLSAPCWFPILMMMIMMMMATTTITMASWLFLKAHNVLLLLSILLLLSVFIVLSRRKNKSLLECRARGQPMQREQRFDVVGHSMMPGVLFWQ